MANMWSWPTAAIVLLVAAVCRCPVVDACSMPVGWHPATTAELIRDAEEVLFGRVRRTFPDASGRPWSEYLYTAEVEVFCIMKGRRTPPLLNITDVGYIPGHCISTNLPVGSSNIVMASLQENVYKARRTRTADWYDAYEIAGICGLQKVYPLGVNEEDAAWVCPTPAPPGECEQPGDAGGSDESPPYY